VRCQRLRLSAGDRRVVRLLGEADTERFQEVQVVAGEGAHRDFDGGVRYLRGVLGDFVEADGGLEHQEHIKTLLADVFDDSRDVLGLGDRFVDRFTKLLDQILDLLIQCHLRVALWIATAFTFSVDTASDYARIGYSQRLVNLRERHCGTAVVLGVLGQNTPGGAWLQR